MARSSTRRGGKGLFTRLYSPIGHLFMASKESVGAVTNTAKGVAGQGLSGLNKIGRSVTGHANQAVRNVFSRKNRKEGGASRKNRKNTRKDRKNRKERKTTRRNRRD